MKNEALLLEKAIERKRFYEGNTLRTWSTFCSNFEDFQNQQSIQLTTSNIDEFHLKSYFSWMRKKGNKSSTINSNFEKIKTVLNQSFRQGYCVNQDYRHLRIKQKESSCVYLSVDELYRIHDYSGELTPLQLLAKNFFLIASFTALRWSDVVGITSHNIIGDNIDIIVQKTGTRVVVPIHPIVRDILNCYSNCFPQAPSLYYSIKTIRNVCYHLGINDSCRVDDGESFKYVPKYKLIGTHTARRSACTNMYFMGIPAARIMKITGHKSEVNFFRYIRVDKEENANYLRNTDFFKYGKENK